MAVMVDVDGNALLDTTGQPITVSAADTSLSVAGDGTISSENGRLGKIGIVKPADPNKMQQQGDHLLSADTPTTPWRSRTSWGGALEESNVQPVAETTRMINELRQFQFVTQFVQGESDRQQSVIDQQTHAAPELRKPRHGDHSTSPPPVCRHNRPTWMSFPTTWRT